MLAATSHLPHVLAYALVDALAQSDASDDIFRFAAGGFRDFTRIASSDPVMWRDIALANREALLDAIDSSASTWSVARRRGSEDAEQLFATFTRAKQARDEFAALLAERTQPKTLREHYGIQVTARRHLTGEARVPGDKSISHRSIMLGALAEGVPGSVVSRGRGCPGHRGGISRHGRGDRGP